MANKPYYGAYSSRMTLSYDGGSTTVRSGGRYKEIISKAIELDNADAFVKLFTVDADQGTGGVKSIAANQVRDFNAMLIHNESDAAVEVLYTTGRFTDNSGSADTYDENISFIVNVNIILIILVISILVELSSDCDLAYCK